MGGTGVELVGVVLAGVVLADVVLAGVVADVVRAGVVYDGVVNVGMGLTCAVAWPAGGGLDAAVEFDATVARTAAAVIETALKTANRFTVILFVAPGRATVCVF